MSLLRSKSSRVILSDNGVLSDKTEALRTWGAPAVAHAFVAAEDALYIGRAHKFQNTYSTKTAPAVGASTMTGSYWNGSAFIPLSSFLDETDGFATDGFLQWEDRAEWQKGSKLTIPELSTLGFDVELFWIKLTLSANSTLSLRAIVPLFSDDRLMQSIFPEIINYLPSGATDFLPQHEVAFQRIAQDLIQSGRISYVEQLKNVEDWMLPATYKAIVLILEPIIGDENLRKVKDDMEDNYKQTLLSASGSLDINKNEKLDPAEEEPANYGSIDVTRR